MFLGFVALITVMRVANRETVLIFPDDRARIAQERADRENNAFYLLEDAQALLPPKPGPVVAAENVRGNRVVLHGGKYSAPTILGIATPPDHPDMLKFLQDAQPAVALARTAATKPFFRNPKPVAHWNLRRRIPDNVVFNYLFAVCFAYGEAQMRYWGDIDGGIVTLSELWTVMAKLDTEPQLIQSRWQYQPFHIEMFKMMQRMIHETDDPAILDALDDLLMNHPPMYQDLSMVFAAHGRALDDTLLLPQILTSYDMETHLDLDDRLELYQMQLVAEFWAQHADHFSDSENLMPTAYGEWMSHSGWENIAWSDYMDIHVGMQLQEELRRVWMVIDFPQATRIVIVLRRFQLKHGHYPGTLDELVPKHIDALPPSLISDDPWTYEPTAPDDPAPAYTLIGTNAPFFGTWNGGDQYIPLEFVSASDFE